MSRDPSRISCRVSRRGWLAGAMAGLVVGTVARPARAGSTKILILGDSMIAGGFGIFLQRRLRDDHALDVSRKGKSSTGLARPDFYNWVDEGKKAFEAFKPDATVCMFGGNDGQGLYMGKKGPSKWIRYEDGQPWTDEYRRRVNAFADVIAPDGQHIFWVGMPVMKPSKLNRRVQHMNTIYRAEMAIRPNAEFVDIWDVFSDDEGKYTDRVEIDGKRTRVRAGDGVHLSPAGAWRLVDKVAPLVVDVMS